jgi:predicted proteasome-type protease
MKDEESFLHKAYGNENEWLFVLLSGDLATTVAVEAWIAERIRIGKNKPDDAKIREAKSWIANVLAEREEQSS